MSHFSEEMIKFEHDNKNVSFDKNIKVVLDEMILNLSCFVVMIEILLIEQKRTFPIS